MADPYWRYAAVPAERASAQRSSFPGHLSSEASTLTSSQPWNSNDLRSSSSNFLRRDIFPLGHGSYGGDGLVNIRSEFDVDGLVTSAGIRRYQSPIHERSLLSQKHDVAPGRSPRSSDIIPQMHSSLTRTDSLQPATKESNVLLVDGLPTDCSRREVGHLFRPFIGFKEIKVIHKEARRRVDKAIVWCLLSLLIQNVHRLLWNPCKGTHLMTRSLTPLDYESVLHIFLFAHRLIMRIDCWELLGNGVNGVPTYHDPCF